MLRDPLSDRVSIIVPTRNRVSLLREALRSALAQTWSDLETVVVDDASTDQTRDMVRTEFPDVRLAGHDVPRGPAGARNAGIEVSSGDWVVFLDDDDLLHPEHVEALVTAARGLPKEDVVSGRWRRFSLVDGKVRLGPTVCAPPDRPGPETLAEILDPMGEGTICGHSVLWPKTLLRELRWDESLSANGDSDLFGRAILSGRRLVGRPVGMAYYRNHQAQRVSSITALARPLSAARFRLKWSDLLLPRPDRECYADAMRRGFMALLINLAGVPEARPMVPILEQAYARWGGRGHFLVNPPRHPFKRFVAAATLRFAGPTGLHWLLKQASHPTRLAQTHLATYQEAGSGEDAIDASVIRSFQ